MPSRSVWSTILVRCQGLAGAASSLEDPVEWKAAAGVAGTRTTILISGRSEERRVGKESEVRRGVGDGEMGGGMSGVEVLCEGGARVVVTRDNSCSLARH